MSQITDWLDKKLYPNHGRAWDRVMFRDQILSMLTPQTRLLDIGAGRGRDELYDFRDKCQHVAGCDVDDVVMENPLVHEAGVIRNGKLPFDDGSFDVAYSCYVWEHLEDPVSLLNEVVRVLRPGGIYLAITPNKWHYVPVIARLTPHRLHEAVMEKLTKRSSKDTFQTWYRLNTSGDIRRYAAQAGMNVVNLKRVEGRPEYLRFSAPSYLCGWLYERWVNTVPGFSGLRVSLITTLGKQT